MIYTQYTTYNTKAIQFKIGTRRSIVFCFHRPSINVILPVQHIAVASGLTGVYMTFPASNSAENGNHGTPTFLKAPIFWKIGQYILMFGFFLHSTRPLPCHSYLYVSFYEPEETSLWETHGCRCYSEYGWMKSPPRLWAPGQCQPVDVLCEYHPGSKNTQKCLY